MNRSGEGNVANVSTISLLDPPTLGCFSVHVEEGVRGKFKGRYAFDEMSGRVTLGVEVDFRECHIYVASIARLSKIL